MVFRTRVCIFSNSISYMDPSNLLKLGLEDRNVRNKSDICTLLRMLQLLIRGSLVQAHPEAHKERERIARFSFFFYILLRCSSKVGRPRSPAQLRPCSSASALRPPRLRRAIDLCISDQAAHFFAPADEAVRRRSFCDARSLHVKILCPAPRSFARAKRWFLPAK